MTVCVHEWLVSSSCHFISLHITSDQFISPHIFSFHFWSRQYLLIITWNQWYHNEIFGITLLSFFKPVVPWNIHYDSGKHRFQRLELKYYFSWFQLSIYLNVFCKLRIWNDIPPLESCFAILSKSAVDCIKRCAIILFWNSSDWFICIINYCLHLICSVHEFKSHMTDWYSWYVHFK